MTRADGATAEARPPRVLFVIPCSPFFPSGAVRVEQYVPHLRAAGIQFRIVEYYSRRQRRNDRLLRGPHRLGSRWARVAVGFGLQQWGRAHVLARSVQMLAAARRSDIVFIQWVVPPLWLTRALQRTGARIVYDFDDAVFLEHPSRADAIVRAAWCVVAGSAANVEYARPRNAATVLVPSAVPVDQYVGDPRPARPPGAPVRIGWVGSDGTIGYLRHLVEPVRELRRRGTPFELVIAGVRHRQDLLPDFGDAPVVVIPEYTGAELPALVSSFDVGVMPMDDGPWERSKCAMKALLYMAAARPAVCSPVGENCRAVEAGRSGYLPATATEWVNALEALIRDPELRARMGAAGREQVEARYSTRACWALLESHVFRTP